MGAWRVTASHRRQNRRRVWLGLLLLAVSCQSNAPAPPGATGPDSSANSVASSGSVLRNNNTTTTRPAPSGGAGSTTVVPLSPLTAPVLGAVSPSAPVAPPPGSPIANIRRDCGLSTPLSGDRVLWIYCDTALFGADQRLQFFVNTSAAVATSDAPTVMRDNIDSDGRPLVFMRPDADYPQCSGAQKQSVWPQSAITIAASPQQARDRVIVWYSNVCLVPGGAETFDIGVAEAWFDVGPNASVAPARVTILNARLFPKIGHGGGYGVASVLAGSQAYVYWCDQLTDPCNVARVDLARVADAGAYRYWNGGDWVGDRGAARPIVMGSSRPRIKSSVRWVPGLDRFAMIEIDAWNMMAVRLAAHPEGPWSAPAIVPLDECLQAYPNNCFAAEIQPHLSGADHLAVSYFDPARPFGVEPTTRLVVLPIAAAS